MTDPEPAPYEPLSNAERQRAWRRRRGAQPAAPPQPCGTWGAYKRHLRAGEPACPACVEANRARSRAYRQRPAS